MKIVATVAIGIFLMIQPAAAQTPAPPAGGTGNSAPVCLQTYLIDHTHTVDPKTILFYMRGGKIWQNTLPQPCPGLMYYGFVDVVRDNQICSNMQSIRVLVTQNVCMLGAFTPYIPPPKPAGH